jgi:hypothetical protein
MFLILLKSGVNAEKRHGTCAWRTLPLLLQMDLVEKAECAGSDPASGTGCSPTP